MSSAVYFINTDCLSSREHLWRWRRRGNKGNMPCSLYAHLLRSLLESSLIREKPNSQESLHSPEQSKSNQITFTAVKIIFAWLSKAYCNFCPLYSVIMISLYNCSNWWLQKKEIHFALHFLWTLKNP